MPCHGTKADGSRCRAPEHLVDNKTGFCSAHGPGAAERMAELGRKGAESTARRFKRMGIDPDTLPHLTSPQVAEVWLDRIARAVVSGELAHREAQAAVRAVEAFLKAHSEGKVARDLEELRGQLETLRKRGLKAV